MDVVESLKAEIRAAFGTDGSLEKRRALVDKLESPTFQQIIVDAPDKDVQQFLQALAETEYTIAWIAVLRILAKDMVKHGALVQTQVNVLSNKLDPLQAQSWPKAVKLVFSAYTQIMMTQKLYADAFTTICTAIERSQPPDTLTPLHAMAVKVGLLSRNLTALQHILDKEICRLSPAITAIDDEDVLLYLYYGGIAYMGLRRFADAQDMFVAALVAPANIASAIAVEAYKKFYLLSLINEGVVTKLPRFMPSITLRACKANAKLYEELATTFGRHNVKEFATKVEECKQQLMTDGNLGLAYECREALVQRILLRITRTYSTISLHAIAKQAQLDSIETAERAVRRIAQQGTVSVDVDLDKGIVSFDEPAQQYDTPDSATCLSQHIANVKAVTSRTEIVERELVASGIFDSKLRTRTSHPPGGYLSGTGQDPNFGSSRSSMNDSSDRMSNGQ